MDISRNIAQLKKLIETSKDIEHNFSSSSFKTWINNVERVFAKVFGKNSVEMKHLQELDFCYNDLEYDDHDYTREYRLAFDNDFNILISSIETYLEDLDEEVKNSFVDEPRIIGNKKINKVFISHSSLDKNFVEELIEILESTGLNNSQIFCSSFNGYGSEFGENFLERIKTELDSNILVLFLLSSNFYNSPVSLCEMGATWMKTNIHIPILIPPFDFNDMKGVIPLTHGFKINDSIALSQFKLQIEKIFEIEGSANLVWERKRDKIVNRITELLKKNNL